MSNVLGKVGGNVGLPPIPAASVDTPRSGLGDGPGAGSSREAGLGYRLHETPVLMVAPGEETGGRVAGLLAKSVTTFGVGLSVPDTFTQAWGLSAQASEQASAFCLRGHPAPSVPLHLPW